MVVKCAKNVSCVASPLPSRRQTQSFLLIDNFRRPTAKTHDFFERFRFLVSRVAYWLVDVDGLDSERFIASSISTMSIDDVDDVSSTYFEPSWTRPMPFSIDGRRRSEMTRTETSAKDRAFFCSFVTGRCGRVARRKSEVEFVTTGKLSVFVTSTQNQKKRPILLNRHAHM